MLREYHSNFAFDGLKIRRNLPEQPASVTDSPEHLIFLFGYGGSWFKALGTFLRQAGVWDGCHLHSARSDHGVQRSFIGISETPTKLEYEPRPRADDVLV